MIVHRFVRSCTFEIKAFCLSAFPNYTNIVTFRTRLGLVTLSSQLLQKIDKATQISRKELLFSVFLKPLREIRVA